tara:strand:+ start:6192 stop:6452 length:261 start_codon:yes stop_codon:yes gene_type:complete
MIKETENFRKKLLFRSSHRGTKEMDIILGTYAKEKLPNMDDNELIKFQEFLNLSDPDLYKWIMSEDTSYSEDHKEIIEDIISSKNT